MIISFGVVATTILQHSGRKRCILAPTKNSSKIAFSSHATSKRSPGTASLSPTLRTNLTGFTAQLLVPASKFPLLLKLSYFCSHRGLVAFKESVGRLHSLPARCSGRTQTIEQCRRSCLDQLGTLSARAVQGLARKSTHGEGTIQKHDEGLRSRLTNKLKSLLTVWSSEI